MHEKAAATHSSVFFNIDEHEILFVPLDSCGKISERETVKPLCLFHVLPLFLSHLYLYAVCPVFSLIFIFISWFLTLLFKSSVNHWCFDNSFHRLLDAFLKLYYLWFVFSGIILLAHVFLSYPPECFYSTQKIFFQSSLPFFDVILFPALSFNAWLINFTSTVKWLGYLAEWGWQSLLLC